MAGIVGDLNIEFQLIAGLLRRRNRDRGRTSKKVLRLCNLFIKTTDRSRVGNTKFGTIVTQYLQQVCVATDKGVLGVR